MLLSCQSPQQSRPFTKSHPAAPNTAAAAAAAANLRSVVSLNRSINPGEMSAGRPPKRPADVSAPVAPDLHDMTASAQPKIKLPRIDSNHRPQEDFSAQVKHKLNQYTRTGQACDRCKVRKIRCDALPEGCSHCLQQNLECYVTDRVTGRTERRGYLQELERDKLKMEAHIRSLEGMLSSNGVEVKPWSPRPAQNGQGPGDSAEPPGSSSAVESEHESWDKADGTWARDQSSATPPSAIRGIARAGYATRPLDSHLGVGSDKAPLSSINGTHLSILGTTVDVTSFEGPDTEEPPADTTHGRPVYNKSVYAFMHSTTRQNPLVDVSLPPRQETFQWVDWYFRAAAPFLPILHQPTFMAMLARIYDDPGFHPSIPEQVMVHMVLAHIMYQNALRNQGQDSHALNERSNRHYHWALAHFFDLTTSEDLEAIQALGMIVIHCRGFPKPGCSAIIANYALHRAIDLNLHRAVKQPAGTTTLDNEMRKRTWWCILGVSVTINGRLGRPMPIAIDDFDVEYPAPVPDELLTDEPVDTTQPRRTAFDAGLVGFKLVSLMIELFSSIYCVRRDPRNYLEVVRSLEKQLQQWSDNIPETLRPGLNAPADDDANYMQQLWVQVMILEYRLSLRHPSMALTDDPKVIAENSRVCEEIASQLLKVNKKLSALRCLDATWFSVSMHVGAMFTTLAAHWERRFNCTPERVGNLKQDMQDWLQVISTAASLIGSDRQIRAQLELIINRTIKSIKEDSLHQTGTLSASPTKNININVKQETSSMQSAPAYLPSVPPTVPQDMGNGSHHLDHLSKQYYQESMTQHHSGQAPYNSLAYQHQPSYSPGNNGYMYGPPPTTQGPSGSPNSGDVVTAVNNPLLSFAPQAGHHVVEQADAGGAADQFLWPHTAQTTNWQEWATAMASTPDHFGANALMTMGRDLHAPSNTLAQDMTGQQWPAMLWSEHPSTTGA